MTREDVNRAIQRYLRTDKLAIVAVSKNAEGLKQKLGSGEASPMEYNSPKSPEIMQEDKTVEKWPLGLKAADISIKPVSEVFQ
jgi:zinc protease